MAGRLMCSESGSGTWLSRMSREPSSTAPPLNVGRADLPHFLQLARSGIWAAMAMGSATMHARGLHGGAEGMADVTLRNRGVPDGTLLQDTQ